MVGFSWVYVLPMILAEVGTERVQQRCLPSWVLKCTCVRRVHNRVSEFPAADATVVERLPMIKEWKSEAKPVVG